VWGEPLGGEITSYRPLPPLLWRVLWGVRPGSPAPFRAATLLLHVLAAGLFWVLARRLGASPALAGAAALLFAVHPAHAEAVGAIVGQADVLAACLGLGACLAALRPGPSRAAALPLALLACLAKETAIVFGAAALLLLAARGAGGRRRLAAPAGLAALLAGFVALQLALPRSTEHWNNSLTAAAAGSERLLLGLHLAGRAGALLVAPSGMSPVHGYAAVDLSVATLAPFAAVGLLLLAALAGGSVVALRRRDRALGVALLLLAGPLVFVSGVPVRMPTDLPERILYPATMAASGLLAAALLRVPRRGARVLLGAALATAFLGATVPAQRPWRSAAALWERAVAVEPKAVRGQFNLSVVRAGQGRVGEAAWHRLLAAWVNDSWPARVDWGPVAALERELPPWERVAAAPARLDPERPCRLVRGMLDVYARTLLAAAAPATALFAARYPECGEASGRSR